MTGTSPFSADTLVAPSYISPSPQRRKTEVDDPCPLRWCLRKNTPQELLSAAVEPVEALEDRILRYPRQCGSCALQFGLEWREEGGLRSICDAPLVSDRNLESVQSHGAVAHADGRGNKSEPAFLATWDANFYIDGKTAAMRDGVCAEPLHFGP
jgi:hypothetical protein